MKESSVWWAGLLALALFLGGCDGSDPVPTEAETTEPDPGDPVEEQNLPPTVTVEAPGSATTVCRGGILEITYTDDDPDDVATTDVFADRDGDLATTNDQVALAAGRPEGDGALQTVMWDTTGVEAGSYEIVVRTDDGTNPEVQAAASGTVDVADVSYAVRAGGAAEDSGNSVATFADGSCVVTGYFEGTATFGPGEAAETTLTADGWHDVFVARYNADGTLAWAKRAGSTDRDEGHGVAVFPDGSCVVTGDFGGTATFGPGEAGETILTADGIFPDVFVARYRADGTLEWARRAGGTNWDTGHDVAAFPDGSCVVTGSFDYNATFGPGEAGETSLGASGSDDVFVARYGSDGTLAWARRAGGWESDRGYGIASFADGSCAVTGDFTGTATFGPGEAGETDLTADGGSDVFVARYDADGTLAWASSGGGTGNDRGNGVASFADGTCVVTGFFRDAAVFGPGEAAETNLTAEGSDDFFVARYGADGALAWARRAGGSGREMISDIAAFADGSCVLVGGFTRTATFGPDAPDELMAEGGMDALVARYGSDGTLAWARRAGGSDSDFARDVAALADGSCVVTGAFVDSATFGPGDDGETNLTSEGESDIFVARYNADGGF